MYIFSYIVYHLTKSKTTEVYKHLFNQHISEVQIPLTILEDLSIFEKVDNRNCPVVNKLSAMDEIKKY